MLFVSFTCAYKVHWHATQMEGAAFISVQQSLGFLLTMHVFEVLRVYMQPARKVMQPARKIVQPARKVMH